MRETFSPRQVAQAVGVSEASLKRWCDHGLLAVTRTPGGHRRLSKSEVVAFLRRRGLPLVRPEILGLPRSAGTGKTTERRAYHEIRESLLAGDEERFRRVLFNLYLSGAPVHVIGDRFISAAFRELGCLWQHGELEIYQERRGCEICVQILHDLAHILPQPTANVPLAIGGTLEADPYVIPSLLIERVLQEAGWRAESFGSGLPASTLCAAIRDRKPVLVWLSVSTIQSQDTLLAETEAIAEATGKHRAAFVVGGRALTPDIRQRLRYTAYGDTVRHLAEFARTLASLRAEGEPPAGAERVAEDREGP